MYIHIVSHLCIVSVSFLHNKSAFGLTTALLQIKHTGLGGDTAEDDNGVETLVWGWALFFGGLLQIIAGIEIHCLLGLRRLLALASNCPYFN